MEATRVDDEGLPMVSQHRSDGAARPALRIYGATPLTPAGEPLSLSAFFESWMAPRLESKGRDPRTLGEYRDSLALWERATRSPAIEAIDERHAAKFVAALSRRSHAGQAISPNTIRKHVTHVQATLDRLLTPTRRHPFGAGLRSDVPILDRPPAVQRDVDASAMTRAELDRLWRVVPDVVGGRGRARNVAAWRMLLELACVAALRLEALWACESSWLADDDLSREFSGRWLLVPTEASKTKRPYRVFLPASAGDLLERLTRFPSVASGGRWFALCCHTRTQHFCERSRLSKAAQLRPGATGMHAIRKLAATELAALNPSAAALQLGHARSSDVTLNHYTGRRVQAEWVTKRAAWRPAD